MKRVYKFPVHFMASFSYPMSADAEIVHVALQDGQPHFWFCTDTLAPPVSRHFQVFGTGHDIPHNAKHLGSWLEGAFVWHLFEVFP